MKIPMLEDTVRIKRRPVRLPNLAVAAVVAVVAVAVVRGVDVAASSAQ